MITLSMLSLGVVILLATITMLSVVASQSPGLQPSVVNPFDGSISFDPSKDTLANAIHGEATLAGDWQSMELHTLHDVETLLDTLETQDITKTELEFAGNNHFVVRWR